jgi:DNA-binding NarL/FixJ family response regulator
MINIIIADDHPIFIDGLKTVLTDVPDIIITGEAQNGKQVLELVETKPADIILLDINMPKMDGIDTAKAIKNNSSHIKIIMLTQFGEKRFLRKCMEIGVEGYLLKDCGKEELINTIRKVFDGGFQFTSKNSNNSGLYSFQNSNNHISEKEKQVLKLIAEEKCNPDIAKVMTISVNTVKTYRERLMIKSGTKTTAGLILWAVKHNLL